MSSEFIPEIENCPTWRARSRASNGAWNRKNPGVLKTYSPAELRAANETARAMAKARGISKAELLRQYGGFMGFLRSFRKK